MANDTRYVRGAERLSRRIATIRANLNVQDIVGEVGNLLLKRTQERFDREVTPDGVPWVPLKRSTIERKRRAGYGDKGKLKRTEALRKSIRIIKGGAGTTFTNTGAGLRIGVEDPEIVPRAVAQNRGTGRIPARRFLGIGRLDVKAVDGLLRRRAAKMEAS